MLVQLDRWSVDGVRVLAVDIICFELAWLGHLDCWWTWLLLLLLKVDMLSSCHFSIPKEIF